MRRRNIRRRARAPWGRWVAMAAAGVAVIGFLTVYFHMMSKLSTQNKAIASVDYEIRELSARIDNLDLCLNQYHNLERITVRAKELGMFVPTESEIRVVYLPAIAGEPSMQSAENVGLEERMD